MGRAVRHCERSEAIQGVSDGGHGWMASLSLAMTDEFAGDP